MNILWILWTKASEKFTNMPHTDTNIGDYEISDDIFSEEHHEEETMMQRKSFFAKLFSTN